MTHLIIDEVHERTAEIDMLLIWARRMLIYDPELRVVLMSATFDVNVLRWYFSAESFVCEPDSWTIPVVKVEERLYDTEVVWLDDIENSKADEYAVWLRFFYFIISPCFLT